MDVSYTMGKHAMKFGASYNRYTKNQKLFLNAEGSYTFAARPGDPIHGHAAGPCRRLFRVAGGSDPPLRKPDSIGLCNGYLEGNA